MHKNSDALTVLGLSTVLTSIAVYLLARDKSNSKKALAAYIPSVKGELEEHDKAEFEEKEEKELAQKKAFAKYLTSSSPKNIRRRIRELHKFLSKHPQWKTIFAKKLRSKKGLDDLEYIFNVDPSKFERVITGLLLANSKTFAFVAGCLKNRYLGGNYYNCLSRAYNELNIDKSEFYPKRSKAIKYIEDTSVSRTKSGEYTQTLLTYLASNSYALFGLDLNEKQLRHVLRTLPKKKLEVLRSLVSNDTNLYAMDRHLQFYMSNKKGILDALVAFTDKNKKEIEFLLSVFGKSKYSIEYDKIVPLIQDGQALFDGKTDAKTLKLIADMMERTDRKVDLLRVINALYGSSKSTVIRNKVLKYMHDSPAIRTKLINYFPKVISTHMTAKSLSSKEAFSSFLDEHVELPASKQIEKENRSRDRLAQTDPDWAIEHYKKEYEAGKTIAAVVEKAAEFLKDKTSQKNVAIFVHGRDGELLHEVLRRMGVKSWYGITSSSLTKNKFYDPDSAYAKYLRRVCPAKAIHVDTGFDGSIPDWMHTDADFNVDEIWLIGSNDPSRQIPMGDAFDCLTQDQVDSFVESYVDEHLHEFDSDIDRDNYDSDEAFEEAVSEEYADVTEELRIQALILVREQQNDITTFVGNEFEDRAQRLQSPTAHTSRYLVFNTRFGYNSPGFWARLYGVADSLRLPRTVPPKMYYDPDRKKFVYLKPNQLVVR